MDKFVVIDTETTWTDKVMSVGIVVADACDMRPVETKYYVLYPEYTFGGMYSYALGHKRAGKPTVCSRQDAMQDIARICSDFQWYDIMRLAAYVQYNPMIPHGAPLFSTGRLKSGYGVQSMLRILSGDNGYFETHNALLDALDELTIMRLLGHDADKYFKL